LSSQPSALLLFLVRAALDDGQYFVLAHDQVLLTIEFDLLARVLAEENEVARLDVERDALAVVLRLAVAGGDDFALLRFFLRGVGDDDPADFLFAFLEALDNDAVVQRSDVHALYSVWRKSGGFPSGNLKRLAGRVSTRRARLPI